MACIRVLLIINFEFSDSHEVEHLRQGIIMQLNNGGESEECDVLILEEKSTEILASSSTVNQDGLVTLKKTNANAKFRDKTSLKRKANSSDEKSISKNKFPRDSRHVGVECTDIAKEKVNENITTALSAKSSCMCYECGKVLESNDLLRVHLLNHSNKISKYRDLEKGSIHRDLENGSNHRELENGSSHRGLENGSNHRDLENVVAGPQTLSQQDPCFPHNSNMSMLVSSGGGARCTVLGENLYLNPSKSSGNFIGLLVMGSGQPILDPKHITLKISGPIDSLAFAKGSQTKHSSSKEAEKSYKCETCGKVFKLHGNFKRHIEKVHGQQGFKSKYNSSGSEISENASECARNLVSSQVDCGQVISNVQREEAARNKSSHLLSNFTKVVSGTVEKSTEKVAFGNNMDCSNMNTRPITILQNSSTASSGNVSETTNWLSPVQDNNSGSPYSCPICFKKLSKGYVKIHLRLHQDRPYSCELCKKSYVTQTRLNRHIKRAHMPKDKSLDESSITNAQKVGIAMEVFENKRDECNVQVDDSNVCPEIDHLVGNEQRENVMQVDESNVCPKTDVSLVGNEQRENADSRTVEKSNKDLGNTAVEYKENMRLDSVKGKNCSQAGSFLGKSDSLNNANSCNVPERCSDVEVLNSLDSDVIVVETVQTKNVQNDKIRENGEKEFRTLPQTSVAHIVTID